MIAHLRRRQDRGNKKSEASPANETDGRDITQNKTKQERLDAKQNNSIANIDAAKA